MKSPVIIICFILRANSHIFLQQRFKNLKEVCLSAAGCLQVIDLAIEPILCTAGVNEIVIPVSQ